MAIGCRRDSCERGKKQQERLRSEGRQFSSLGFRFQLFYFFIYFLFFYFFTTAWNYHAILGSIKFEK